MTTVTSYGRRLGELKALFIDAKLEPRYALSDDLDVYSFLMKLIRSQDKQAFLEFVASSHEEFVALPAVALAIYGLVFFAAPREYAKLRADATFRALVEKYEQEEDVYLHGQEKEAEDERSAANTLKLWAKAPVFHPTEIFFARTAMSLLKFPMKNDNNQIFSYALPLAPVSQISRLVYAISLVKSEIYPASEVFPEILDALGSKSGIAASLALELIRNFQKVPVLFRTRETRKSFDRTLELIVAALDSEVQLLMDEKNVIAISDFALAIDSHKRSLVHPLLRRLKAACIGCAGKLTPDTLALLGKAVATIGLGDAGFREFVASFFLDVNAFRTTLGLAHAVEFARTAKDGVVLPNLEAALIQRVHKEGIKVPNTQTAIAILRILPAQQITDYAIRDKLVLVIEEQKDQLLPRDLVAALEAVSKVKNVRSFTKLADSALPYLQSSDVLRAAQAFLTSYDSKQEQLNFFTECARTVAKKEVYVPERDAPLLLQLAVALVPLNLRDRVLSDVLLARVTNDIQALYVKASRVSGSIGLPDISDFLANFPDAKFTKEFANEVIKNGFRTKRFFSEDEIIAQLVLLVAQIDFPEFAVKYLKQQVFTRLSGFRLDMLVLMLRAVNKAVTEKRVFESSCLRPVLLEICERKGKGSDENTDSFEVLLDELQFPEHKIALFAAIRIGQQRH